MISNSSLKIYPVHPQPWHNVFIMWFCIIELLDYFVLFTSVNHFGCFTLLHYITPILLHTSYLSELRTGVTSQHNYKNCFFALSMQTKLLEIWCQWENNSWSESLLTMTCLRIYVCNWNACCILIHWACTCVRAAKQVGCDHWSKSQTVGNLLVRNPVWTNGTV